MAAYEGVCVEFERKNNTTVFSTSKLPASIKSLL